MAVTAESIEAAARKIKALQAQQSEIEEAIANYKAYIADNLPEGENEIGSADRGWLKATVYTSRRYDEAYGKRMQPELWEKYAVEKRSLDSATAKKVLSTDEYASFQRVSSDKSVKIEVLDD